MKYTDFEELPIYQEALKFCKNIYQTTQKLYGKDFGLIDQTRRASVSIVLNIAEGFERGTNRQFANFLNFSKASASEVRASLNIGKEVGYLDQETYRKLIKEIKAITEKLGKFQSFLKYTAK